MVKFVIPIEPKAQERPRATVRGGHATIYESKTMREWRNRATDLIKQFYKGPYFDKPIKTNVVFYMSAPKNLSKTPTPKARHETWTRFKNFMSEQIPKPSKPDLDNLEKALYDSISKSGVVWTDDNIIVEHTAKKMYSPSPRIEIEIVRVDDGLS